MKSYSKISPRFWTGETGRRLRKCPTAQIVAMYLCTAPMANMIGVFYLPISYISADTGLTLEGASEGLRRASEVGFCTYDEQSEFVFVHEMASWQIGETLKEFDNRGGKVLSLLKECPKSLARAFSERYEKNYALDFSEWLASPSEAPSKPVAVAVAVTVAEGAGLSNASTDRRPDRATVDSSLPDCVEEPAGGASLSLVPENSVEVGTRLRCEAEKVRQIYNELLPELPQCAMLTKSRRSHIEARFRQIAKEEKCKTSDEVLNSFRDFFTAVRSSPFLMGLKDPGKGRSKAFRANLDWLMTESNFVKVCEGRYFDAEGAA